MRQKQIAGILITPQSRLTRSLTYRLYLWLKYWRQSLAKAINLRNARGAMANLLSDLPHL